MHPMSALQKAYPAVNVLVVNPFDTDVCALQKILVRSNWVVGRVSGYREAVEQLRERPVSVVICERELPDGDWKMMLEGVTSLSAPPRVIVTSHTADDQLWTEVLRWGGYDVLPAPFEAAEVFRVISLAAQSWHRERQPAYAPPKPQPKPQKLAAPNPAYAG
jgi:DNA-binding NtrC family response regulator